MTKRNLIELIKKVLSGTATPAEEQQVNQHFYDSFYSEDWDNEHLGNRDEVKQRILTSTLEKLRRQPASGVYFLKRMLPYAAAVILLVGLIWFIVPFSRTPNPSEVASKKADDSGLLSPGSDIASLQLSDGTIVDLATIATGSQLSMAGALIQKTSGGNIRYTNLENEKGEANAWNVLRTPIGGTFHITLADGTNVWLNAESSLSFPKTFTAGERKVHATGEVYFEVSHDAARPFIVSADGLDVKVLGTRFNLSGYPEDKYTAVALVEGSVELKPSVGNAFKLTPGKKGFLENGKIQVRNFDTESEVAWKNNYFIFKDRNIQDIMTSLARWYDADVQYQQGVNWEDKNFTVRMSRRENIGEILSLIELTQSVKFATNGRKILVYKN